MQPIQMTAGFAIPGGSGPKTLLSVFPQTQRQELRHEGYKMYEIEGAEKGSYSTLKLTDTFAWCRDFSADTLLLYPAPIPAQVVAENLLQRWTTGMIGTRDGLGPGIILCAGAEPTAEEIAQATARQEEYFRSLIYMADAMFAKGEQKDITDLHRLAANWMGANDRAWVKKIGNVETRECPECFEEVKAQAKFCKHCRSKIEPLSAVEPEAEKPAAKAGKKEPKAA